MKKAASLALAVLLASPPLDVVAAPEMGTIKGAVTVSSRPIRGVSLAFVDLASGNIYRATSADAGAFEARVPAGRYVLTTENGAGLAVGRAPSLIAVLAGQVATADVDLAPVSGALVARAQPPPADPLPGAPPTSTVINYDPKECVVAGEFPLFDANIQPAGSVARARCNFKAAGGDDWYYVEMTPGELGFVCKLPRPKLEASPITFYIQATTTEFGDGQSAEHEIIVVAKAEDCPDDKKVAGIGPPGEVTVFSAATGTAIAPVGFAAGGLAL
ncbi:MAG TPA: carboxypeptidase-like regulatory domain-containing protein, partial [Vicinamibacteria bacterium]|nr:carboxypeptidase-like regulatory domain-containing protein [Vicinamibacteria bacterium]